MMACARSTMVGSAIAIALVVAAPAGSRPHRDTPPDTDRTAASLAGWFLIAGETMADPRFAETVVFMVEHDSNGAMGFVVNRPLDRLPLAELLDATGRDSAGVAGEITLHWGGPVQNELAFLLHTPEVLGRASRRVTPDIAFGVDLDMLVAEAQPDYLRVLLGYAGWGPGQLERELAQDAWLTMPAEADLVFDPETGGIWERAIGRHGIDTRLDAVPAASVSRASSRP